MLLFFPPVIAVIIGAGLLAAGVAVHSVVLGAIGAIGIVGGGARWLRRRSGSGGGNGGNGGYSGGFGGGFGGGLGGGR